MTVTERARAVGLKATDPSLSDIERRRVELWALAIGIVCAATLAGTVLSDRLPGLFADTPIWLLRLSIAALAAGFLAYVIEKEVHLRRLERLLFVERVRSHTYAQRAREMAVLAEAAHAVNAAVEVHDVLERVLDQALAYVEAVEGAVLLVDDAGEGHRPRPLLRASVVRGERRALNQIVGLGHGHLGEAALTRIPKLRVSSDDHPSTMIVPLVNRDELLGVIEVAAQPGRDFTDYELNVLTVFAGYVAVSVVNARLYEAERARVAELTELDELKSEFLATVSHELKTPLTAIIGSVSAIRNVDPTPKERAELLAGVDRQARRLADMVDQLLVAARLAEHEPDSEATVDLADVVRTIASDFERSGRGVRLSAPASCVVGADQASIEHVLWNLLDNAHKHGAPPVSVHVESLGGMAVLSVSDAGPGVPPEARDRVFERFCRLDSAGRTPGMGLGLPIVRRTVEACGGRVWIDDAVGGGAAVRVALPRAETTGGGAEGGSLTIGQAATR